MAKTSFERHNHSQRGDPAHIVPDAPAPSAPSSRDGMKRGREKTRRYIPDLVDLYAGIALSRDSDAGLHTKYLAGKELGAIAGIIPPVVPAAPVPMDERPGDGSGPRED